MERICSAMALVAAAATLAASMGCTGATPRADGSDGQVSTLDAGQVEDPTPDGGLEPDGAISPAPDGGEGAFPSPATTGWAHTGVTLSAYAGPGTITAADTVIDGKDITTCLVIDAKNVTIKRSRIRCASWWGIRQLEGATGLLVEDTEVTSASTASEDSLVDRAVQLEGGDVTLRRVHIHDTIRGVYLGNDTITVEDSYIGDNYNPGDAHTTAIVSFGGADHVVIRHNTLKAQYTATAALALERDYGVSDDYLIEGNLLATDGGYCFYAGASNLTFKNNRFSTEFEAECGIYGHTVDWEPSRGGLVWEGNSWHDPGGDRDGEPVPEP